MQSDNAHLSVAIIGAGNVGQSLYQLFSKCGYSALLCSRSREQQVKAISTADIVLITTTDQNIHAVCDDLRSHFKPQTIVSHCSGALDSKILLPAKKNNCFTASIHPLNTFPSLDASLKRFADTQHGTYLYSEGDEQALSVLTPLFSELGFNVIEIEAQAKTAYHTACVFACNYLTALMDMSLETAESAHIDRKQFWLALQPLINATLDNITKHGTTQALSGPIARGDADTITTHLDVLSENSHAAYTVLGERAFELAKKQGKLSEQQLIDIRKSLQPDIK